jgi:hypothetical protein
MPAVFPRLQSQLSHKTQRRFPARGSSCWQAALSIMVIQPKQTWLSSRPAFFLFLMTHIRVIDHSAWSMSSSRRPSGRVDRCLIVAIVASAGMISDMALSSLLDTVLLLFFLCFFLLACLSLLCDFLGVVGLWYSSWRSLSYSHLDTVRCAVCGVYEIDLSYH